MKGGKKERKEKESDSENDDVVYENVNVSVVDIASEPRARMRATSVEKDL